MASALHPCFGGFCQPGRFGRPSRRWKPQMIQSSFRTAPDVENHASAGLLWHAESCGFAGQERNIVLR